MFNLALKGRSKLAQDEGLGLAYKQKQNLKGRNNRARAYLEVVTPLQGFYRVCYCITQALAGALAWANLFRPFQGLRKKISVCTLLGLPLPQ
jgi:hypothetical protein